MLSDGHLSCPEDVKKKLNLSNGSIVKVAIKQLDKGKITKLKGMWKGVEITDEDIKSMRREMWGKIGTEI